MIKVAMLVAFLFTLALDELLDIGLVLVPGLSAKNAFLYLLLLAILCNKILDRPRDGLQLPGFHLLFVLLIGYAALSIFFMHFVSGQTYGLSLFGHVAFLKGQLVDMYLLMLVFFYASESARSAVSLAKLYLGLVSAMSLITLIDVLGVPELGLISYRDGRLEGPLGQANEYAVFLAFFTPVLLFAGITMKRLPIKLMYLGGAAASLALLIQTGSRGGVAGFLGGLLLAGWWLYGHYDVRKVLRVSSAFTLGFILLLGVMLIGSEETRYLLQERVERSTEPSVDLISAGRTWIWAKAIDYQMDKPWTFITGNGWRSFTPLIGIPAHSAYMNYLFTLGLIGLGLFLGIVRYLLVLSRRTYSMVSSVDERILIGGLVAGWFALVVAMSTGTIFKAWLFVWPFTGLCLRIAYCAVDQSREATNEEAKIRPEPVLDVNRRGLRS